MKLVFLYSDILFFILIFLGLFLFLQNKKHFIFQKLNKNNVFVSSMTILIFFMGIATLDSIHFRPLLKNTPQVYSIEVISLLDYLFPHLKNNVEKTYSAPFATRLFTYETVDSKRIQPRLKFGGAHLENENNQRKDILQKGFFYFFSALFLILLFYVFQKKLFNIQSQAFWITFSLLFLFSFVFIAFSYSYHPLGTDKAGQDVFYQILKSIRVAILIGTLTTFILLPLSLILGVLSGYFGGWIDDLIQYIYTVLNSIPSVLLIAAFILMMDVWMDSHAHLFLSALERSDMRLLTLCAILGITNWTTLCRLIRAETLKLREMEYVTAAKAFGVGHFVLIFSHIVPNLTHLMIINVAMDFSALVLSEAVLSYVGIGVDPSMVSFGTLINNARLELSREPVVWWILSSVFFWMLLLVLSANLFADSLQKALNPKE